jgi:hypothetical protein
LDGLGDLELEGKVEVGGGDGGGGCEGYLLVQGGQVVAAGHHRNRTNQSTGGSNNYKSLSLSPTSLCSEGLNLNVFFPLPHTHNQKKKRFLSWSPAHRNNQISREIG